MNITDSHIHVVDPAYPMVSPRSYTPLPVLAGDVRRMMARCGVARVVVVQISVYGNDNAALLAALGALGDCARGVVHLRGDESEAELTSLHDQGVRGVRVNLYSTSENDPGAARLRLHSAAEVCARRDWHLQLLADPGVLIALAAELPKLAVPVVVDHFGLLPAVGRGGPAEKALLKARETGRVWVKLSADYRLAGAEDFAAVTALARDLEAACPETALWGSDFPHPPVHAGRPVENPPESPYRKIETAGLLDRFRTMFPAEEDRRRMLESNPARLYAWP